MSGLLLVPGTFRPMSDVLILRRDHTEPKVGRPDSVNGSPAPLCPLGWHPVARLPRRDGGTHPSTAQILDKSRCTGCNAVIGRPTAGRGTGDVEMAMVQA